MITWESDYEWIFIYLTPFWASIPRPQVYISSINYYCHDDGGFSTECVGEVAQFKASQEITDWGSLYLVMGYHVPGESVSPYRLPPNSFPSNAIKTELQLFFLFSTTCCSTDINVKMKGALLVLFAVNIAVSYFQGSYTRTYFLSSTLV
jgi:hypothetical protein